VRGHSLTVLSDQDASTSRFDHELPEAEIVICQACSPVLAERIAKAQKLRLVIVTGEGAEDIDLDAAAIRGITVAEITHSSTVSIAEYAIMLIVNSQRRCVTRPRRQAGRAHRALCPARL
jgi:formate dehydrogenase